MESVFLTGRRWIRSTWIAIRMRAPRSAKRIREFGVGVRLARELSGTIRTLEERVEVLERDQALLSAHIAAASAQRESKGVLPEAAANGVDAEDLDLRLVKVRLGALAYYEQRISRLERKLKKTK